MSQLKSYEYVIAIAEHGGISQAAEALHIAQPALSRYLKKLETELETDLFDRSVIPIRLTEAGRYYVEMGMQMLVLERQLQKQLREIRADKNTVIRIGISPTRSPYLMPRLVETYQKQNPESRVIIKEHNSADLHRLLAQGELDLMISWLDEDTQMFSHVELFEEEIFLAVPRAWDCQSDDVAEILRRRQLINIGHGQALWHITREITEQIGASPPTIECQSIEAALAFVKRGLGATLVPSYIVHFGSEEQNRALRFLPLSTSQYPRWTTAYQRRICLFYRKEQRLTQAERAFIACAREVERAP